MTPLKETIAGKPASRMRGHLRFTLHYVEMIVAMFVGMFALAPLWSWLVPGVNDRADVSAMVMATNMSIGMAAWMRFRGRGATRRHSWCGTRAG